MLTGALPGAGHAYPVERVYAERTEAARIVVYAGPRHDAFPGLELLGSGEFVVAFRIGSGHVSRDGRIALARAPTPEGPWSTSTIFDDRRRDDRTNLGLTELSDGTLLLPFFQHNGRRPVGAFVLRSRDRGRTWRRSAAIETSILDWVAVFGRVVEGPRGGLLLPAYGMRRGRWKSVLFRSTDRGRTWRFWSILRSGSIHLTETSVIRLGRSRYLALSRGGADLRTIYELSSNDGARTWSRPTILFDEGVAPDVIRLASGALLACVGDRNGTAGVRCHLSHDRGETWSEGTFVFKGEFSWDGGYSSSVQLGDGRLFTAFYTDSWDVLARTYSADSIGLSGTLDDAVASPP